MLTIVLTACGGGGGSGPTAIVPKSDIFTLGSVSFNSNYSFVPSMVQADFTGDGSKHVVVSGWLASGQTVSRNPDPEVKIFKINSSGTGTDVTNSILGGSFSTSVNWPIVADFNNDGIDDIFFGGFTDAPSFNQNPSTVFLSRPGQSHEKIVFADQSWVHSSLAVDLNGDGRLDILGNLGDLWLNQGAGNFTHSNLTWAGGPFAGGGGLCAGDFNNTGRKQIVFPDAYDQQTQQNGTFIFDVDTNLNITKLGAMPTPYFDRNSLTKLSHNVSCVVADFNQDGRLDVVVISARADTVKQSMVQLYINQGNYVFSDATDTAFAAYNQNTFSSYVPVIKDFNNDSLPDLWLMNMDYSGLVADQIWINHNTGVFTESNSTKITKLLTEFLNTNNSYANVSGIALPVSINNQLVLVLTSVNSNTLHVGSIKIEWQY